MMYKLSFELRGLPKTTNARNNRNYHAVNTERKRWKKMVLEEAIGNHPIKPLKLAKLKLTRFSSICPDYDGLVSSFKSIVDGLVDAEILENDKMKNIGAPEYLWEKIGRGKGKVRIEVWEENLSVAQASEAQAPS